jgi:hypothetical protein
MNLIQMENPLAFNDPLPAVETIERMKRLCLERDELIRQLGKKEIVLRAAKRVWMDREEPAVYQATENEATRLALQVRGKMNEIVNVARLIVAESDNGELIRAAEEACLVKREGKCDVVDNWKV